MLLARLSSFDEVGAEHEVLRCFDYSLLAAQLDEVPSSGLVTLVGYSSVIFAVLGLVSGF